jgi:hypothetical protein
MAGGAAITLRPGNEYVGHRHLVAEYDDLSILAEDEQDGQAVEERSVAATSESTEPDEGDDSAAETAATPVDEDDPAEDDDHPDGEPSLDWLKDELRAYAANVGVATSGTKQDILDRINDEE